MVVESSVERSIGESMEQNECETRYGNNQDDKHDAELDWSRRVEWSYNDCCGILKLRHGMTSVVEK